MKQRDRVREALVNWRIISPGFAEHPDPLTTLQNLAVTLYAQGDPSRARDLVQRVVDGGARTLGPENPATVQSRELLRLLEEAVEPST